YGDVYCYPLTVEIASCGFSWALWKDFNQLSNWADVIHYQFPWPFADILALIRQNKNTPYIVSYQSDIVRQRLWLRLYKPLMVKFLNNAHAVVATSPNYIASSKILNGLKRKPELIPNGIDDELGSSSYEQQKAELRAKYGEGFYLFIGAFRYYKGLKYLLESAKITKLPIVIVGSGPELKVIKQFIRENQLTHVHILGQVSDNQKHALISLAKALVLPSSERSEAYGMVLLEAARQGTPMISTELGSGTSFINVHGKTGLVVPSKNASELAKAMQYMQANPTEVAQMAIKAKSRFKTEFTSQIMARAYKQLYSRFIA
ncbi:MAG TPA: glycosyltransferase, partial [Gammaproteobacteria bacterium]|nr:glycosyltransferase [Gammaproteobacteria bacterium]